MGRDAAGLDVAALGDGGEQCARPCAAARDPGVNGLAAAGGGVHDALLPALAAAHRDGTLVVVIEQQGDRLTAPEAASVQQGEHGRVAGADRGVAADAEQRRDLADVDVAPRRQSGGADVADVDGARKGLCVDQAEPPGFLERAAHGCQHMVDGGGFGAFLNQHRAQRHNMLIVDLGPVHHEPILGEPASEQLGCAVEAALQAAATDGRGLAGEIDRGRIPV